MGTEHYLYCRQTRRAYILGKGVWGGWAGVDPARCIEPFPVDPAHHREPTDTARLVARYFAANAGEEQPTRDHAAYARTVAVTLWPYLQTSPGVELRADTRWYEDELLDPATLDPVNFTVVGSRYRVDTDVHHDPLTAQVEPLIAQARAALGVE